MDENINLGYGPSHDLFVTRKLNGESLVIGGVASDASRWARVVSHRAAQLLWFQMAQILDPERALSGSASVTTAPMRDASLPTVTTHLSAEELTSGCLAIKGWIGARSWHAELAMEEAFQFWTALDRALYPCRPRPTEPSL
jgi:hypothetical protein